MINGKKKNFEIATVWFDPVAIQEYVILEVDDQRFITLLWLSSNLIMTVPDYYCKSDDFIRKMSSLEMELL